MFPDLWKLIGSLAFDLNTKGYVFNPGVILIPILQRYIKISEVNLFVFIYRLFHEDFSSIVRTHSNTLQRYNIFHVE